MMVFKNIERRIILNSIWDCIQASKNQNTPNIIEINGGPGVGKSVILDQLEQKLKHNSTPCQTIHLKVHPAFSIITDILDFLNRKNLISLVPEILLQKFREKHNIQVVFYELILAIRNNTSNSIYLILDDTHLMHSKNIQLIKEVFSPPMNRNNVQLVLCGRTGSNKNPDIEMKGFSIQELSSWFEVNFSTQWLENYSHILDWVFEQTNGNPLHLTELLNYLLVNGKISKFYSSSLNQLTKLELPRFLPTEKIHEFRNLPDKKSCREILNWCSIYSGSVNIKILQKLSSLKKHTFDVGIKNLIDSGWIVKDQSQILITHPLFEEQVKNALPLPKQSEMHNKLLKYFERQLPDEKKTYHILESKNYSVRNRQFLIKHAQILIQQQLYHDAIRICETLANKENCVPTSFLIANAYKKLGQIPKAMELLTPVISSMDEQWKADIYLLHSELLVHEGKLKEALPILESCQSFKKYGEDDRYTGMVLKSLTWINVRLLNYSKVSYYLSILKDKSIISKNIMLDYHIGVKYATQVFPKLKEDYNSIQNCKSGIDLAISLGRHSAAAEFYSNLQVYYMKIEDYRTALKYGKLGIKCAGKEFSPRLMMHITAINGVIFYVQDEHIESLHIFKRYSEFCFENDLMTKLYIFLSYMVHSWFIVGNQYKLEEYRKILINSLEKLQAYNLMDTFPILMIIYSEMGEYDKARKYLINMETLIENKFPKPKYYFCEGIKYLLLNKQFNDKRMMLKFQESIDYLYENGFKSDVHNIYFSICLMHIRNSEFNKLSLCLDSWNKNTEYSDEFEKKLCLCILESTRENFINLAVYILELESRFCGLYLWHYKFLYNFLMNFQPIPREQKFRYKELHSLISFISSDGKTDVKSFKSKSLSQNGFLQLLRVWKKSIEKNSWFPRDELERFTDDETAQDKIENLLNLWNISVKDEIQISELEEKNSLIIRIFGKPQIFQNGKCLTVKGKITRMPMAIIAYLLLHSYQHYNSVDTALLVNDIWTDVKELGNLRNNLNVQTSKIRKYFTIPNLFEIQGHKIDFNWDSFDLFLDIRKYEELIDQAQTYQSNGNGRGEIQNLELAAMYYRGPLFDGFDALWLEKFRTYFLEKQRLVVERLMVFYQEQNRIQDALELIERMIRCHPEVEEFKQWKVKLLR